MVGLRDAGRSRASATKSTWFKGTTTTAPLNWPRDGRELLRVKAQHARATGRPQSLDASTAQRVARDPLAQIGDAQLPATTGCRSERWTQDDQGDGPQPALATVRRRRLRVETPTIPRRERPDRGRALPCVAARCAAATPTRPRLHAEADRGAAPARGRDYASGLAHLPAIDTRATGATAGHQRRGCRVPALGVGHRRTSRRAAAARIGAAEDARPAQRRPEPASDASRSSSARAPTRKYVAARARLPRRRIRLLEMPPRAATLDGFLFNAKQGYCQQFSGAMALLLRIGGIPARVATGFTSGA